MYLYGCIGSKTNCDEVFEPTMIVKRVKKNEK
jgi:hypothetical protein